MGIHNVLCEQFELDWPPPERLYVGERGVIREAREDDDENFIMERYSMSALPDDIDTAHLARGAVYRYIK